MSSNIEDNINKEIKDLITELKTKVIDAIENNHNKKQNIESVTEKENPNLKIDLTQQNHQTLNQTEESECSQKNLEGQKSCNLLKSSEKPVNSSSEGQNDICLQSLNSKDSQISNDSSVLTASCNEIEKNLNDNSSELKNNENLNGQPNDLNISNDNIPPINSIANYTTVTSIFNLIANEINELKSLCKDSDLSPEDPMIIERNFIKLRFEYNIDLKDSFLIKYVNQNNLAEYSNPVVVCKMFDDLIKQNKVSDSAIQEIFEILNKIVNFLDEKSIYLVESILEKEKSYNLLLKYELISKLMKLYPNQKYKWMVIFIENLENLVKSYNDDEIDMETEFENQINKERNQKIKEILEIAKFSFYQVIDLDKINLLKRIWTNSNSRKLLKDSSLSV